MKKYLLTACYLLLTFIIFKHPVELPKNEVPKATPIEEVEQNFANNAIATKVERKEKESSIYVP
ncbi:MAG: hypothetical protein AB8F74_09510 [Saprospiraceae bacterium]